jgi:hypothetical protein
METLPALKLGQRHKAFTSAKRTRYLHLFELDPLQTRTAAAIDLLIGHVAR